MIRIVALSVLIAGTVAAETRQGGSRSGSCTQHEARFPGLIGGTPEAAEAALRVMPGIATLCIGGPNKPMTMDHRADRATILVVEGRVRRITCG